MKRGFNRARLFVWSAVGICAAAASGLLAQGQQLQQAPPLPPPIDATTDPLLKVQQFMGGRGGFGGPSVAAGSYLVKVMIGDVIAQKTVVVEADRTFMQQ